VTEQNFFFDKWNREAPKFDKVMDALPPDRLDYRPAAGSRSAAEMSYQWGVESCSARKRVIGGSPSSRRLPVARRSKLGTSESR